MSKNRSLLGVIGVVAAAVIIYFGFFYPQPSGDDLSATIGTVAKHQNEQITNEDVVLAGEESTNWTDDPDVVEAVRWYTDLYLRDQFIFYLDPFLNIYTGNGTKHSLKARILNNSSEMTNNQSVNSTLIYADYQLKRSYEFIKGFELIGGVSMTKNMVTADMYKSSGSAFNDLLNVSAYLQAENEIKDMVFTSIGVRGEYYQLNDSITALKPIFRAGVNFKLYPSTFLRVSYGQGYRFPSITERYIKTSAGSFAVFNNPCISRFWSPSSR